MRFIILFLLTFWASLAIAASGSISIGSGGGVSVPTNNPGTANDCLITNGDGTVTWASCSTGSGTVTDATVPAFLSVSGGGTATLAITYSGTALPTANGGTGQTSLNSTVFTTLYETIATTLGDLVYGGASGAPTRLAGQTTTTKKYLSQTGNGTISAAPAWAQVAFSDLSGSVAASQLPNPSSSTLGGVQSAAAQSHKWINTISTSGVPGLTQPACADISDAVASCSTDTTNATNISSGTLNAARLPATVTQITSMTTTQLKETVVAGGTCSTSYNVDPTTGTMFNLTLSGACALGVTNLAAGHSFTVKLTQSSTTAPTFTSAYKWATATTPTFSTSATKYDMIACVSLDGTTLDCSAVIDVR